MTTKTLELQDFEFEVPAHQIAQLPLDHRDASKYLILDKHSITHSSISDIHLAAPEGALFIVNDSRVIASRLSGKLSTGGAAELLLLEPLIEDARNTALPQNSNTIERWMCLGKPMKKFDAGTRIYFPEGLIATIIEKPTTNSEGPMPIAVELNLGGTDLMNWLARNGEMPLPPYIARKNPSPDVQSLDKERYQTVYAQEEGSVAAPTAGLHFSKSVIEKLKAKNCEFASVTLHVGAGTFLPVKTNDPALHVMHTERFFVTSETLDKIAKAKQQCRKVVVVGTTALRCLEGLDSLAKAKGLNRESLANQWQRTNIFVYPKNREDRYKSWCADALMTNFHQPGSTLFMLVCALIGFETAHKIYREAIANNYRFFSYGDSSLLWL